MLATIFFRKGLLPPPPGVNTKLVPSMLYMIVFVLQHKKSHLYSFCGSLLKGSNDCAGGNCVAFCQKFNTIIFRWADFLSTAAGK